MIAQTSLDIPSVIQMVSQGGIIVLAAIAIWRCPSIIRALREREEAQAQARAAESVARDELLLKVIDKMKCHPKNEKNTSD